MSHELEYAKPKSLVAPSATAELLKLAMPIIGMMVSRMAMGFIDFVMVSRLGTDAQAAISPATIFVFALACLGMGAAQSVQTFVSQADGRGEPAKGGGYAWQVFYIAVICGFVTLPIVLTTNVWFGWIARISGHDPGVAILEVDYIRIALWSVAPAVVCAGLTGFFNGIQRPSLSLIAVLASLLINVLGNYALIFGNWGFPEMGIEGAAVATVLAWFVRMVVLTGALLLPKIDERYNTRKSIRLDREKMAGIMRVGGPTAIQWLIDIGAWVVFMAMIVPAYGKIAMAASNVALQYMHFSFMPAIGIGMALCSQVGFAIGEGRPDDARMRAKVAMRVTGVYMGIVGLIMALGGYPLMVLMSKDPEVIRIGVYVLIWAAVFQVFDAMGITYMNALRGAGDTRVPAIMVAFCCWVIFIGGGYGATVWLKGWNLHGPWAMCTIYISLLGVMLWLRWRAGHWREIRLFDKKPASDKTQPPLAKEPIDDNEPVPLPVSAE